MVGLVPDKPGWIHVEFEVVAVAASRKRNKIDSRRGEPVSGTTDHNENNSRGFDCVSRAAWCFCSACLWECLRQHRSWLGFCARRREEGGVRTGWIRWRGYAFEWVWWIWIWWSMGKEEVGVF